MVENSIVIRGILRLFAFIWAVYDGSIIKKCIDGLFNFFSEIFKDSILYPLFTFKRLKKEEYPFFMNKLKGFYAWLIGVLNNIYERAERNSKVIEILKNTSLNKWWEASKTRKLVLWFLQGASIEAVLICLFCLAVPVMNKQLSLVLSFGIFALFLLSAVIRNNRQFYMSKTTILAVFYFAMLAVNSVLSINPKGSFRDLMIHLGGICIMFAIINSPLKKKDYQLIFNGLIGMAMLVSFYALYQFVAGVPMGSGWVDPSQNPGLTVRVFGTFENPNTFAEYLILILPLVVARGIQNLYEKKWLSACFMALPAGVMLVALLMTASRGGWLGFAFGSVIFVLLINMKFIIPMIIGGVGMIPLLPKSIIHRISTIGSLSDSSNLYRYNLWKSSAEIVKDFFVTGIGTGYMAFRSITPYYMKNMAPYHTHNTYLQTLVEFGLIGLILFLTWCFLLFKDGADTARKSNDFVVRLYSAAITAGFCSILLHGIAEHILYYSKIMLLFWVFVGLIIKANDIEGNMKSEQR